MHTAPFAHTAHGSHESYKHKSDVAVKSHRDEHNFPGHLCTKETSHTKHDCKPHSEHCSTNYCSTNKCSKDFCKDHDCYDHCKHYCNDECRHDHCKHRCWNDCYFNCSPCWWWNRPCFGYYGEVECGGCNLADNCEWLPYDSVVFENPDCGSNDDCVVFENSDCTCEDDCN